MAGGLPRGPRGSVLLGTACMLAVLMVAAPSGAGAEEVSFAELSRLAAEATDDPLALERLRGVDEVGGRPADIGAALAGAEGADLAARLQALASPSETGAAIDPEAARSAAERIVGELPPPDDTSAEPAPRPLELDDGETLDLGPWGWIAAAIALIGGGLLAYRLIRGRERVYAEDAADEAMEVGATPDELARRAGEAERAGDYAGAVRLRLRWALGVLGRGGAIETRSSLSPAGAARQLDDPGASELIGTFERVVYGREPAGAADAEAAREGWPGVIERNRGR